MQEIGRQLDQAKARIDAGSGGSEGLIAKIRKAQAAMPDLTNVIRIQSTAPSFPPSERLPTLDVSDVPPAGLAEIAANERQRELEREAILIETRDGTVAIGLLLGELVQLQRAGMERQVESDRRSARRQRLTLLVAAVVAVMTPLGWVVENVRS
jgi:hypothetical protein